MPLSWRNVVASSLVLASLVFVATTVRAEIYDLTGGGSLKTGNTDPVAFPIDWELGLDSGDHTLNLEVVDGLPPIVGTWTETSALTFKANITDGYQGFLDTVTPDAKPIVKSFKFPQVFILGTVLAGEVKSKFSQKVDGKRVNSKVTGFFSGLLVL